MDTETVVDILEEFHEASATPQFYNNEQALRSVVIMAYLTTVARIPSIGDGMNCTFEHVCSNS